MRKIKIMESTFCSEAASEKKKKKNNFRTESSCTNTHGKDNTITENFSTIGRTMAVNLD